jgi:predicted  nucleic acid-binding Zn-ribbon protein
LTGAEKQKRHREKVKARLAEVEAEALQARAAQAPGEIPGLKRFYEGLLRELGATAEEAKQLSEAVASFQGDLVALLRERGQAALEALRRQRARSGSSLLSRLAAIQDAGKGG